MMYGASSSVLPSSNQPGWSTRLLEIDAVEPNAVPATGVLGQVPNDGDLFDRLLAWTDNDDALLQKILVDTPKKLYDFN